MNSIDELTEALATIEHEQWMHWSRAVASDVPKETRVKWERSWISYETLTEELKDADRIWARKVIALLQQRRLLH